MARVASAYDCDSFSRGEEAVALCAGGDDSMSEESLFDVRPSHRVKAPEAMIRARCGPHRLPMSTQRLIQ